MKQGVRRRSCWPFWLAAAAFLLGPGLLRAQIRDTKPMVAIRERVPSVHAFVNARIVQGPGRVIPKGILVIRDGVVESVGKDVPIPDDARVWDLQGLTIYPGLVDPYTHLGMPGEQAAGQQAASRRSERSEDQQAGGALHRNPKVRPETDAAVIFRPSDKSLDDYRKQGITAVLAVPRRGIFRGMSAAVLLAGGEPNDLVIRSRVAQHLAFERRGLGSRGYPASLMGCIALIRQTFLDAEWYAQAWKAYRINPDQPAPEQNVSLAALVEAQRTKMPVVFEVDNDLDFLRAAKIYREFGLKGWIRGSGYEYRRTKLIRETGLPVVLPVNFPEPPKVDTPEDALRVSLQQLVHWEAAPENARILHEAGVRFAFTTDGLRKVSDFLKNVRQTVKRGLDRDAALAALTMNPAQLIGLSDRLGTLDKGKLANFLITDGDLFESETKLYEVWVKGERFVIEKRPEVDPRGKWQLAFQMPDGSTKQVLLALSGEVTKLRGEISLDKKSIPLTQVALEDRWLRFAFVGDSLGIRGVLQFSGRVEKQSMSGYAVLPDGSRVNWSAAWKEAAPQRKKRPEKREERASLCFARGAFTRDGIPPQPEYVLVKNATVWTMGPQGVLKGADLLVHKGKIEAVGAGLKAPSGAIVIDATGKHVTPGLIDEHSHTAISGGVNEGTRAITCEVRIVDVLNPDDIAIYRELAGGLTVAHPLHGSANPIGGQNAVIKLRWGALRPDELIFEGFHPDVKFALGENPKRSNFRIPGTEPRYPQTRLGVEQIIRDRFKAALDYKEAWDRYNSLKDKRGVIPPRRDLQLEALLEIVEGKRWIRCHSYRQDEILAIVRLAKEFGATLRTLEHGLEAYKVADVLADENVDVSCFSDWWAYKFEVYDAIPYNGPILHNVGVVVSYNSDSNELARRLNTEAAKAVKYGGLSKEEALRFVTLNPAIQLGLEDRVGSLEPGKDADFVIWSDDPLSYFAVCEQTWIDGRKYFDREEDMRLRTEVERERQRIIQKILARKKGGTPSDGKRSKNSQNLRPQTMLEVAP